MEDACRRLSGLKRQKPQLTLKPFSPKHRIVVKLCVPLVVESDAEGSEESYRPKTTATPAEGLLPTTVAPIPARVGTIAKSLNFASADGARH